MKVLLLKDVVKLGYLGDVVEANAGYARNYLIPQGLAVEPTEGNLRSIAKEKARRSQQRISERKHMEEACAKAEGAEAVVAAKANEQGVLFGSVTAGQIAANLREQGYEVADDVVQLAEHIKRVGTHSAELWYAEDLKATVSVVVVREGEEISELEKEKDSTDDKPESPKEQSEKEQVKQAVATQQTEDDEKKEQEQKGREKEKKVFRWFGRKKE